MTFGRHDLDELWHLLQSANAVVPMRAIHDGMTGPDVIGMRHDVDANRGALETAVKIARWESHHGFRSTFFMLHTSPYWETDEFPQALDDIAALGHEIGIHTNAITEALLTGRDPHDILLEAITYLRLLGHEVVGVAAHGDPLCYRVGYVNDEQFAECARPEMGAPDRLLRWPPVALRLDPRPLAEFGLLYDTHRLPHGRYLSDSGGAWNEPFPGTGSGQLHVLQHPDWWGRAFARETITA